MLPEQTEHKPEEIVRQTGWGFLISGSKKQPVLLAEQPAGKNPPVTPDTTDQPPPPKDH